MEASAHTAAVFLDCCFYDLLKTTYSILVKFPSNFFPVHFVSVNVVHPSNSKYTTTAWKKSRFILSDILDFHMIYNLSIAFPVYTRRMLTSLSVDGMLLPSYGNCSTNFRDLPLRVYNACSLFYWNSRRDQCFLMLTLGYVLEIRLGLIYLRGVLGHLLVFILHCFCGILSASCFFFLM